MHLFKAFLLKSQNPIKTPHLSSTSFHRSFTSPPHPKTPLSLLFKEAVGLSKPSQQNPETHTRDLNQKLWDLETELRGLREVQAKAGKTGKQKPGKPRSLYGLFRGETGKMKGMGLEPQVFKELSPEMEMLVGRLYEEGYFRDANFLRGERLDFGCFDDGYGRDFIKFAAGKYGQDHQEIAKWLSGSDLKMVALFGCPSLTRKDVFSAKRLRRYFEIQENTVCGKCVLKNSCKFANQSVWKGDTKSLNMDVVMKIITLYALDAVHPELTVPDEIKASVSRLLTEVVKLSRTGSVGYLLT